MAPADAMSVKQLKTLIEEHGLSHADCTEKHELRARAHEALAAKPKPVGNLHRWEQIGIAFSTDTCGRYLEMAAQETKSDRPRVEGDLLLLLDSNAKWTTNEERTRKVFAAHRREGIACAAWLRDSSQTFPPGLLRLLHSMGAKRARSKLPDSDAATLRLVRARIVALAPPPLVASETKPNRHEIDTLLKVGCLSSGTLWLDPHGRVLDDEGAKALAPWRALVDDRCTSFERMMASKAFIKPFNDFLDKCDAGTWDHLWRAGDADTARLNRASDVAAAACARADAEAAALALARADARPRKADRKPAAVAAGSAI